MPRVCDFSLAGAAYVWRYLDGNLGHAPSFLPGGMESTASGCAPKNIRMICALAQEGAADNLFDRHLGRELFCHRFNFFSGRISGLPQGL